MKLMRGLPCFVPVLLCLLAGCSDEIIGDWEGEIENSEWELTFLDNGTGEAEASPNGIPGNVSFDLTWEAVDDHYEVELDCKRSTVQGLDCEVFIGEGDYDCEIDAGGDLVCDRTDCDGCEEVEFKKKE